MRMPDAPRRSAPLERHRRQPDRRCPTRARPAWKISRQSPPQPSCPRDRWAATRRRHLGTRLGSSATWRRRDRIQRGDEQKHTRILCSAARAVSGGWSPRADRLSCGPHFASASANPPEPTAIADGPAADIAPQAPPDHHRSLHQPVRSTEYGNQRAHVARLHRRHRIAADCRQLHRLAVDEQLIRPGRFAPCADRQGRRSPAHRRNGFATPRAPRRSVRAPNRASSNRFSERHDRRRRRSIA